MSTRIILLVSFFALMHRASAQDTIVYANGERIIGQVEEIQRDLIRYRTSSAGNAVVVSVEKKDLDRLHLAGGQRFQYGPGGWTDPASKAFMQRKNVVSLDLFAPALDHVTVGYERSLTPRSSLVLRVGKIGLWRTDGYGEGLVDDGFLVKMGPKLMLAKSLRRSSGLYANHPLAGWYLRPEVLFSYWKNTSYYELYTPFGLPYEDHVTQEFHSSAAVNLVFGGQFFLGDRFCLDVYGGMGYGVSWRNGVTEPQDERYPQRENYAFSHTFFGGRSPLCVSGGALLGYVF